MGGRARPPAALLGSGFPCGPGDEHQDPRKNVGLSQRARVPSPARAHSCNRPLGATGGRRRQPVRHINFLLNPVSLCADRHPPPWVRHDTAAAARTHCTETPIIYNCSGELQKRPRDPRRQAGRFRHGVGGAGVLGLRLYRGRGSWVGVLSQAQQATAGRRRPWGRVRPSPRGPRRAARARPSTPREPGWGCGRAGGECRSSCLYLEPVPFAISYSKKQGRAGAAGQEPGAQQPGAPLAPGGRGQAARRRAPTHGSRAQARSCPAPAAPPSGHGPRGA